VGHNFIGDLDLTPHSVDGDERAFELLGLGEVVEQIWDRGDLVGLFRNRELSQGQAGVGGVGAERMQGFETLATVVGAPRRLAVDGDEVVAIRPERGDPAFETAAEENGVDAVDEGSQPALAGNAEVKLRKTPQKTEMVLTQAAISSKSSQEEIVAQVTSSRTSSSRYMIRSGSRSSERSEKCSSSSARRAFGAASPSNKMVKSSMAALRVESAPPANHVFRTVNSK